MSTMQDVIMAQIIELITKKNLRIFNQANCSNMGILRCTDKGWLNTVLGIRYDFQYESASFSLKFNNNEIVTSDGNDRFYISYDRNPDESFAELLATIETTLS